MNTSATPSFFPSAYSTLEEWLNSLSHGVGLILAIIGLVLMLQRADSSITTLAAAIYGATLILMFLTSTLYHAVSQQKVKPWLKLLDHSAIYLLIAGTYTPFLLVSIGGLLGWITFAVIMSIAIFGVSFKCIARTRFPKIALTTYLVMGWLALAIIYPLYQTLPSAGLWLLLAGGLCFSIGVFFYLAKRRKYSHFIWHLFVIAGAYCHFLAIYNQVIPLSRDI